MGNSLFSILPIYFLKTKNGLTLSNDPLSIQGETGNDKYDKRFLLETILFNYPLFDHSCKEGVRLLPANHYLQINECKFHILQHTAIENYFVKDYIPWKKATDNISDLFIDTAKKYFPDELYATSLTGGFDGRTLTACGQYYKKTFLTYSFGTDDSKDIQIAEKLSKKYNLDFCKINLDNNYLKNESLNCGLEFIQGSTGCASFARSHYLHAARNLAKKTRFIITGNFGSEIFRAAHVAGVVISPNLYNILTAKNYDEAIRRCQCSYEWNWLHKSEFINEWDNLKEDLKKLSCFDPTYKSLPKNQQFYKIVFEEIFRKYFGAEMVNQYRYLANRTPFLDIDFLKGIFCTGLAGVYSDFFTHNPFKRFKGQVLYAYIIKKAYPGFANEPTDKGYRPIDLLSNNGKLKIAFSYIKKKYAQKNNLDGDSYAVNAAFSFNRNFWNGLNIDPSLFAVKQINESIKTPLKKRDSLFIVLSQAWFYGNNFAINSKRTK
jgi:hypothetical protein